MNLTKFKDVTAFVLGYTGGAGKEIARLLLERDLFKTVVLIGRREVDYKDEPTFQKAKQVVVDFENIDQHESAFQGATIGFCALGCRPAVDGVAGVQRVDHDYVVNSAKIAKKMGCSHFCLVSATGSDVNSWFEISRIKGHTEEDVKAIGFDRLTIAKPKIITGKETRPWTQKFLDCAAKPIDLLKPGWVAVSAASIGKALINDAFEKDGETGYLAIYDNAQLNKQAKTFDQHFKE
uniref:Protein HTATIP2 n=1 Tax=Plectus sambesii TaxID=2011161 RepID=A0A914VMS7_9BILA